MAETSEQFDLPKRPLWLRVVGLVREFLIGDGGTYSASISYQMMLAFFPALLLLKSVQHMLGGQDWTVDLAMTGIEIPSQVLALVNGFLMSEHGVGSDWRSYLDLTFLVLVLKSLSHVFEEYSRALHSMIDRPYRLFRGKIVSGMAAGVVLFMSVAFFLMLNSQAAQATAGSVLHFVMLAASHALLFVGLTLFFAALAFGLMSSKAILVSALCAMIVWSGVSYIVFLIDFDFREEQRLYGEVASLVVLLIWFFVTARALIFSLAIGVYLIDGKSQ
jgi:uncharacterized BrkB/YihY/UPF0761 family membrane protein